MNYVKEAERLIDLGISCIPLKDNEKRPSILWKEFQSRLMTSKEVEKHFKDCGGIAAITGSISRLFCLDFDLNKQLPSQDYFKKYMALVPEELKKKMLVNSTKNQGYHLWLRTDYEDQSRKLTRRYLTIPELMTRYETALENNVLEPEKLSQALLNKPLECIIESRSRGSYAVLSHTSYKRFYGKTFQEFTKEEVEFLVNCCYCIDCEFTPLRKTVGDVEKYSVIRKYNDDTTPEEVIDMLCDSGVYSYVGKDHNNSAKMKRIGSSNPYSARVFHDTGIFSTFSQDTLFKGDKSNYTPFEVYCAVNNLNEDEAVNQLKL